MRSEILRVDRQDLSKAFEHPLIISLDLTELAKLLKGYAVARKGGEHLSDIAFSLVQQTSLHENPRLLKQRAGISGIGFHNSIEDIGRFIILFKFDVGHSAVDQRHRAIFFIEFSREAEGINRRRVLSLIE